MIGKNAELEAKSLRVQKLIERIENGAIKIPEFQRGYVWRHQQVIELLESISNNFPIGSLLLWEASNNEKLRSTRNISGINLPNLPDNHPVQYCLDGQQRISTLFGVFWEHTNNETNSQYNPDRDVFEVYYDLIDNCFIHNNNSPIDRNRFFYLRNLLNQDRLIDDLMTYYSDDREKANKVKELSSKFLNYEVPIIQISNRTINEVGVIFERINNTGIKLNTMDLMTAWTWDENFHLREEIDELLDQLYECYSFELDNSLILQISSAIINNSTSTQMILSTESSVFKNHWSKICESIKLAIDYITTNLLCKSSKFLPRKQLICGISYFYYHNPKPTAKQLDSLGAWFWISSFNRNYDGGRTTQKMDSDLTNIKKIIAGEKATKIENLKLTDDHLKKAVFSINNSLTRSFLLLQAQNHPIDLISGLKINIGDVLSNYNRSEFHHVFPDSFLKRNNVNKKDDRYKLLNFCFLSSSSNKKISSKAPSIYFNDLIEKNKITDILNSNMLPTETSIYSGDHYLSFIKKRSRITINAIENMIKGK